MVAAEARGSIAARHLAGTLPWIGVNDSAEEQRTPSGLEKLTGAHDPRHVLQKSGGLADQWYMDDGDIMCHPILVLPFLQDFDVANARVGAERNPLKTEVIHDVNDLDERHPSGELATSGAWAKPLQSPTAASRSESVLGLGSSSRTSS